MTPPLVRRIAQFAALASLAVSTVVVASPAAAADAALGFDEAELAAADVPPAVAESIDRSVQWRAVDLDVASLRAELASSPVIELFDDAELVLPSGTYTASAGDGEVWTAAAGLTSLTVTIDGDRVRGSATIDGRSFSITPVGDHHVIVEEGEIDADVGEPIPIPDDMSGLPTAEAVAEARELIADRSAERPARTAVADQHGNRIVRVLTVYTNGARATYGGDQAARTAVAGLIDDSNSVLANSQVAVRLESAGIAHVDHDDAAVIEDDLDALTFPSTDALFDVHVDREVGEADIVMMVRGPTSNGTCGLAWLLQQPSSALDDEYAFGVVDTICAPATKQYAYIHEVGHILGAGHGNQPGDGVFPYSAGYRNVSAAEPYRTIMAYEGSGCPCPRIPYFSAPRTVTDANLGKVTIGSANRNNSRTLNETAAVVANFRPLPLMPTPPARLVETRSGPANTTIDGEFEGRGRRPAGSVLRLQVAGRGDVPDDAAAAMLNVTAVLPDRAGHITVWPCNEDQPTASNLNYTPGQVVPNSVLAKLDGQGRVCIYTHAAMHLLADVTAYVPADSSLRTLVPERMLETRSGGGNTTTDGRFQGGGARPAGSTLQLQVAGRGEVESGMEAAMLNVTAILPDRAGHITVWPCNEDQPTASSLNYASGQVVANAVLAKLDPQGRVCIYTHAAMHLVVDVNGAVEPGSRILSVKPARLLETRRGPNNTTVDGLSQGTGPLGPDDADALPFVYRYQNDWYGRGDVTVGALAAIVNVTAVLPDRAGHITVWPCTDDIPTASNLNYVPGQVVANLAIAEFAFFEDFDGPCLYSFGRTDLLVDVVAYF